MKNRPWLLVMIVAMLTGCELLEHRNFHDPHLKILAENPPLFTNSVDEQETTRDIPTEPKPTEAMKLPVTLSVSPGLSLQDICYELSLQTGVDLAFSPHMEGRPAGVVYSAKDKPVIKVIEDLCRLTQHRFQVRGDLIFIEPEIPYLQTYQVNFLSQTRASENRMSVTTDVFTVMENSKSRADNGSDSVLKASGSSDFWGELEGNLQMIVQSSAEDAEHNFTFHKQAGLVAVNATAEQHKCIREYLTKLQQNMGTQVLIEARIMEVNLHDEFRSGINWNVLGNIIQLAAPMGSLSSPGFFDVVQGFRRDTFSFAINASDFATVVNLVKTFGEVHTLSNPRMTVMNNQPAMLKVATNEVFFQLEFDRYFQADGKPDVESFSSHIMTVPIGLVLVVQPAVNHQTGEIMLTLRPTVSRIESFVEDPAVAIKSNQKVTSRIPVVQVREIDSVLKLQTGGVVVLGGLMEERSRHQTSSIPFLDQVPILSELVRGKDEERKVTELVIFLTASMIHEPSVSVIDERLYNVYSE
jgi:MSHA type pilus biogenesis protein MshL